MINILNGVWLNSLIGLGIIFIITVINVVLAKKQTAPVAYLNQLFFSGIAFLFGLPTIIYIVLGLALLIYVRYRYRYILEGANLDYSGTIFSISRLFNNRKPKKDEVIIGKILPVNHKELKHNNRPVCLNDTILSAGTLLTGASGSGKAEPNSAKIPVYDNGNFLYKQMGELQIGDFVYNREGIPTEILGVFPQGKLDIYEIELADGRTFKASGNHLITYKSRWGNGSKYWKTVELHTLIDKTRGTSLNNVIPANQAVYTTPIKYDIPPYIIGAFLGNGCRSYGELQLSSGNEEVPNKIVRLLNTVCKSPVYIRPPKSNYTYSFCYEEGNKVHAKHLTTNEELIHLLTNTYSYNKYIPFEYKFGSIEQRWELLQGLFDTDGTIGISTRYNVSYSSTSKQLIKDIQEILYSLGISSSITEDTRHKHICYHLHIKCNNIDKQKFFTLSYKLERAKMANSVNRSRVKSFGEVIGIRAIRKLDYQEECTCIYIADEEHLYQGENFVVTHNTTTMRSIMQQAINNGKPVVFVDYKGETEILDDLQKYCSERDIPYYEFSARRCTFTYDPLVNLNETGKVEALMNTRRWSSDGADEHYKTSTQLAIQNVIRAYDKYREQKNETINYLVGLQQFMYSYKPESNERDGFATLTKQLEILLTSKAKEMLVDGGNKFSFETEKQYVICFSFISANKALANSMSSFIFQDIMDRGTRKRYNPRLLLCIDEFGTMESSTLIKDLLEKGRSGGCQTVFSILDVNQIAMNAGEYFVNAILGTINSFIIHAGATQTTADLLAGVQKYEGKGYSIMDLRKPYRGKSPTALIISKYPLLSKKGNQEMYRIIPYIYKNKKPKLKINNSVSGEDTTPPERPLVIDIPTVTENQALINGEPFAINQQSQNIDYLITMGEKPVEVKNIDDYL
jgi:hypothetical protein